jgi:hypothetical protein
MRAFDIVIQHDNSNLSNRNLAEEADAGAVL